MTIFWTKSKAKNGKSGFQTHLNLSSGNVFLELQLFAGHSPNQKPAF